MNSMLNAKPSDAALVGPKDNVKVTKVESFVPKNSQVYVKISTDVSIVGWGEMNKDEAKACAAGALEVGRYLVGQDPRRVVHHWQAIHRGAFFRGGPIKTSILSGIDQALWDIKGKALGVPIYELLGGPVRDRCRVYGGVSNANGVNATKVGPNWGISGLVRHPYKHVESPAFIQGCVDKFAGLREKYGPGVDIAIDFHGAVQPATAMLLIKALEPYQPFFFEEVVQCLNVDIMADIAKKTHIPIATGERIYTKWGFREILEKRAPLLYNPM